MSEEQDIQKNKTNLMKFEQESNVLEKDKTNSDLMVSNIQDELFKLAADMHNSTFLIGSKLLDVQRNKLYREWGYEKFSEWLLEFCKEAKIQKTKLWDSKKIVTMLEDTSTPFSEVSNTNIKGLYQIARIHKKTNDDKQVKQLIEKLNNKEITVTELKKLATDITKTEEQIISEKKRVSTWFFKVYSLIFVGLLLLLFVVLYI
jgi:hypothetical protein